MRDKTFLWTRATEDKTSLIQQTRDQQTRFSILHKRVGFWVRNLGYKYATIFGVNDKWNMSV